MVGLCCELSWPSKTMCFGAGGPSNLFKFLLTLSFLIRATNATRWHGKLSEGHIAAFNLYFSQMWVDFVPTHSDSTYTNMTSQTDNSISASVLSHKHLSNSSSLCSNSSEAESSWRFRKILEKITSNMVFILDQHSKLDRVRSLGYPPWFASCLQGREG